MSWEKGEKKASWRSKDVVHNYHDAIVDITFEGGHLTHGWIQMHPSPPTFLLTTNQRFMTDHGPPSRTHEPRSIVPQRPKNPPLFLLVQNLLLCSALQPCFGFWERNGSENMRRKRKGGVLVRNLLHQLMYHHLGQTNQERLHLINSTTPPPPPAMGIPERVRLSVANNTYAH